MDNFDPLSQFRERLEREPSLPIERAAEALGMSVRNLYRRRGELEHFRKSGHLFFTIRDILRYIEIEQYNATATYDLTQDVDSYDDRQPRRRSKWEVSGKRHKIRR
jgi:hypothetical protein